MAGIRVAILEKAARNFLQAGIAIAAFIVFGMGQASAQPVSSPLENRIIVSGEGTVSITPDMAQIVSGVTRRANTVKAASDANAKTMNALIAALMDAGIEKKDIQTARFSVQPVYTTPEPRAEPKLSGYSVSNQVSIKVRDLGKLGDILDRLIAAGANDVGNVSFHVSEQSKALDGAREAAIGDARRKAEIYARAAGIQLGRVEWINEDQGFIPFGTARTQASLSQVSSSPPVEAGEDTFHVRVTVGFAIVH